MKPRHWAVLAALVLGIPAGYGGLFLVGVAIGWHKARRTPPPVMIRYVDRVVPRSNAPTPPNVLEAQDEDATP